MGSHDNIERELVHTAFLQREEGFAHHTYSRELIPYFLLRRGDPSAREEAERFFNSGMSGRVSEDPLRNQRYLFVAATTLATRFAIEGGLGEEVAYNMSDIFIQRMDALNGREEILSLQCDMIESFSLRVAAARRGAGRSAAVREAAEYVYMHLHESISIEELSAHAGLSRAYFSTLFKRETGVSASRYIRMKRVEAAENMLRCSKFTLQEIGAYLAFTSESHFISVFREETGLTPKQYRAVYAEGGALGAEAFASESMP